jgi:hypothetical protein
MSENIPDLSKSPLDALLKVVNQGELTECDKLANMDSLDITQKVRLSYLAKCVDEGMPSLDSEASISFLNLLNHIDDQVKMKLRLEIDRQKLEVDKTNSDSISAIKDILLANPSRLGSAQELAKRVGGDPVETFEIPITDKSKLEGYDFLPGQLSNEHHGLDITSAKELRDEYARRKAAEAKAAVGNKTLVAENQDT